MMGMSYASLEWCLMLDWGKLGFVHRILLDDVGESLGWCLIMVVSH